MKLLELHIDGFGKFHDRTFQFNDGLNIIYGENEAGKSTLHAFIKGILFGIDKQRGRPSKNDPYTKYDPWDGSAYQGYLRLESNGCIYRIERIFRKETKELRLTDETNGRALDPEGIRSVLCGLTESNFTNTISIGQLKSATDASMVEELKDHIANLNTSGSIAISTTRACEYLKKKKRALEASIDQAAEKEAPVLEAKKEALQAELSDNSGQVRLNGLLARREDLRQAIEKAKKKRKQLVEAVLATQSHLEKYGLTSSAGITDLVHSAQTAYEDYQDGLQVWTSRLFAFLCPLGFAGCIAFLVCAKLFERQQEVWMSGLFLAAAILAFFVGNSLFKKRRGARASMEQAKSQLSEYLARIQTDTEPTPENMERFYQTLNKLQTDSTSAKEFADSAQSLLQEIDSMQTAQAELSSEIEACQHLQWETEKKVEQLTDCANRLDGLSTILAANGRIRQEIEAVSLAMATINRLAGQIHDSFGLYLNTSASRYIGEITGGAYSSISVDTNLNIFLNTPSRLIPIEQVSAGTIDQVYLAMRLAIASFLWPDQPMPLLLDDSFALYDDARLRFTLKWLQQAYPGQILLFTCHTREKGLADGANLIAL